MAESKGEKTNLQKEEETNKDSLKILRYLELVMIPIECTTGVGLILFLLSGPLNVFDMEIWGYFLMAFSILLSFFVLIGYRGFLSKEARKSSGVLNNFLNILSITITRLPALLLFAQLFYLGWTMNEKKQFLNIEPVPKIVTRIRNYITIGIFTQLILYFVYYVGDMKSIAPPKFNTASFAIISLLTSSLIVYLDIILNYFIVDG
tara:strand:+ start:550 stop:1164 length:615 start_codon:yes stop_codon:yes gene_type:complete